MVPAAGATAPALPVDPAAAPWTTQAGVVSSAALSATIMIRRIVPPLAQR